MIERDAKWVRGVARGAVALGVLAAVAMAGAGCGDDDDTPFDAGTADAGAMDGDGGSGSDGGAMGDGGGGADGGADGGTPACTLAHLLVTTTAADFSSAGLGALAFGTSAPTVASMPLDDTDAIPSSARCLGLVLARAHGELRVMRADDPTVVDHVIDVDPAGTAADALYVSNPVAVADAGAGRLYVVNQLRNAITIVDPALEGATAVLGEIDLSDRVGSEDTDGLVDATDAVRVGDRVFVALGHYFFDASFAVHFTGSEIVAIDIATDEVMGSVALTGDNPWRGLVHDEATNTLLVGATGDSFARDGRIERVDLDALTTMGDLVTESALDAEINGFALVSSSRLLVLAGTTLVAFDPATGPSARDVVATDIDGMVVHEGIVYAFSRTSGTLGLRTFDATTGSETTPASGPITFGDFPIFAMGVVP